MSEATVILSDLHANGRALRAAIARADELGYDRMVILGDLLTYGIDQDEVLDLVAELVERRGASVLLGNHDQLYLDLAAGDRRYYDTLPAWLRETVDRTLERLDIVAFRQRFRWLKCAQEGPWLLAHANPWAYGDWRYLYTPEDALRAAETLRARGFSGGVFGHTHRRHALRFAHDSMSADGAESLESPWTVRESDAHTIVVNPGSIGQPRHKDCRSTFLRLERANGQSVGAMISVDYDVTAHVRALREASFAEATRDKLCRFFEP
jgi:predicted phosphodiesterase